MAAKKAKVMSFADLEAALGLDELYISFLFCGQATASADDAEKLASLLSLDHDYSCDSGVSDQNAALSP